MNAAGMPPWYIFRPFLGAAIAVSLLVAVIAAYISPKCLRELRLWAVQVRTDILTNNLQPGRYLNLDAELTRHIRDRIANGQSLGILAADQPDPKERNTTAAPFGDVPIDDRAHCPR